MIGATKKPGQTTHLPEAGLAAVLERIQPKPGNGPLLLPYLPQQHPVYRGKSANAVKRERGQLFAVFAQTGLPESALPYVLEVLETEPYAALMAGAARALRGLPEPRPQLVPYLLKAITIVQYTDDTVFFVAGPPLTSEPTTALREIAQTFQWFGSSASDALAELRRFCADPYRNNRVKAEFEKAIEAIEQDNRPLHRSCCEVSFRMRETRSVRGTEKPHDLVLEDQERQQIRYGDYFRGKPAVVVFFYTRCDNPNKCSLTIARLGHLQKALQAEALAESVKIAAITYDPFHDDPFRMKAYGEARGLTLDDENRLFRAENGLTTLLNYFDSGVNYMGSLVNHHTTELFVLDEKGMIVSRYQQLQWQLPEVIADLKNRLSGEPAHKTGIGSRMKAKALALSSPVLSFLIVFFPKCPLCWAAYLSVFGITNLHVLRFASRMQPLLIALLCFNVLVLYRVARRRNGFGPVYWSLAGLVSLGGLGVGLRWPVFGYLGIGLLLVGALLNSLPHNVYIRFRLGWARLFAALRFRSLALDGSQKEENGSYHAGS
ncbi:SCO family protein [Larkinella bovis]|uniref:SCO family protein n=1 Tax=Larkinella bovis TaxID=683041 RepID=A0ABW0II16_9BACT